MLAVYRREWHGSVFSAFIEPLVVLAGLGIGLGVLVGDKAAAITGGVSYVTYIAPALMASSAMNLGAGEAAWPILARVAWVRIYHAIIATPLNAADVMVGAIAFIVGKVAFAATFFAAVLLITGIATSPLGALGMIGVSILTAFAFAAPIVAFSVTQKSDQGFAFIFRLIITPLAFFSGTYFPIENLPFAAQVLSWCTPLAHGVALSRALALGTPLTNIGFHLAALLLWGVGGTIAAIYLFRKRMLK
ncbi:MAG: ABC transporter permease [Chloroflexi bacterium]|jgi:lipooligosaccharide transport system permease protein|nr:ABC transporter permease [Chloroflexota bacterium]